MNVVDLVEQHLLDRLRLIKRDGAPVMVYGPDADRTKGRTVYPCIVLVELDMPGPDVDKARPHLEIMEPSDEQSTVFIPQAQGGGQRTGPVSWTVREHPIPVTLAYQIEVQAADKTQARELSLLVIRAVPAGYRFTIDGMHVLVVPDGDPKNLDGLEKPLFRRVFRYSVEGVWMEGAVVRTVPSITTIEPITGITEA